MRLTLRTLLAYLDGILEPNDAQDLGKKVEESEFATSLVRRIRDVIQRLRLGAPSPTEHGSKADPNRAAEYLDNTLPPEDVAEFEKVCLESDVHLAEVASSHQILTLVLGEPAEIDPASRQRMYELKNAPTEASPAGLPVAPPPIVAPSPGASPRLEIDTSARRPRPRPTVPEYLRDSRHGSRWLPTAAAAVLVVCFPIVLLYVLGQFEPDTALGNVLVRWGVVAPRDDVAVKSKPAAAVPPPVETVKPSVTEPVAEAPGRAAVAEEPAKESELSEAMPPAAVPEANEATGGAPKEAVAPTEVKETAVQPAIEPPAVMPAGEAVAESPKIDSAASPPKASEVPSTERTEIAVKASQPLGRLVSTDQVLLTDEPDVGWALVSANQPLTSQPLLALPTYRAKILLDAGATIDVLGPTRLDLLPGGPQDLPGIHIRYGRVVIASSAKGASRLRVAFGDRSGVLTLADAESVAAIAVLRVRVPGSDPEASPSRFAADLYVTSGGAEWTEPGTPTGKAVPLTPLQWLSFNGELTSAPAAAREVPKWIAVEQLSYEDQQASPTVAQALQQSDRVARVGLLETNTSRPQREVKRLTQRCLGCIGVYRDIVAMLNDPARKLEWWDYIDQLREAVGRDAESAAAVRVALEKQYPQQAAELYRMLWGYTDKDLQAGEDAKLVRALSDNDTLAVRVLAIWNLQDLTGLGGQSYRPEQPAVKRQQATLRWKQRLEADEIRLKTPEVKLSTAVEEDAAPPASPAGPVTVEPAK